MRKHILEMAQRLGLFVATSRPGDGSTRYYFTNQAGWTIGTAVGAKIALAFLQGYESGYEAGQEAERQSALDAGE